MVSIMKVPFILMVSNETYLYLILSLVIPLSDTEYSNVKNVSINIKILYHVAYRYHLQNKNELKHLFFSPILNNIGFSRKCSLGNSQSNMPNQMIGKPVRNTLMVESIH